MWFSPPFQECRSDSSRRRSKARPARRQPARHQPILEILEDRCLPAGGYTLGKLVQVSGPSLYAGSTADNLPPDQILLNSEDENQLVVDPTNPNHLVALWQGDETTVGNRGQNVGVTFDGGKTWHVAPLPGVSQVSGGPLQSTADPWLAFAPNGDLYATCLAFTSPQQFVGNTVEDNVLVLRSTDGGLSWGAPTVLHDNTDSRAFNDKESITTDPSDPNLAYMTWNFLSTPSGLATRNEQPVLGVAGIKAPLLFTRTTDGGRTWEHVQTIYDPGANALTTGPQIVVRPDGVLLDIFTEVLGNKNNDGGGKFEDNVSILMSKDNGQTWQNGTPIRATKMFPVNLSDPDNGTPIDDTNFNQDFPDVAVDPHNGYLYAVWRDGRFSGGLYSSIAFAMSTDGGLTWSTPIQINKTPTSIPAGNQQAWLPSVKVAADGTVAVTYYDFRNNDPKPGLPTDYCVVFGKPTTPTALTHPGNWGNELRLTDKSFDLEKAQFFGEGDAVPGLFLGDYEGLKAVGNDFVATFCVTDVSPTDPKSIFFRRIIAGAPLTPASSAANAGSQTLTPEASQRGQATGVGTPAPAGVNLGRADLIGATPGLAAGQLLALAANPAGWGWVGDPPRRDESALTTPGGQGEPTRLGLLTVRTPEPGSLFGAEPSATGRRDETLVAGPRRTPPAEASLLDPSNVAWDSLAPALQGLNPAERC
jgi:hypothetical protein